MEQAGWRPSAAPASKRAPEMPLAPAALALALLAAALAVVTPVARATGAGAASPPALAAVVEPATGLPPPPPAPPRPGTPLTHALEVGGGFGRYSDDLGYTDGEFVRYSVFRNYDFGLRFDVGRQARFGESSFGGGVSYSKSLPGDAGFSVGIGSGTGDILAPRYRFDVSVTKPVLDVVVALGYTRVQSKAENKSDGFSVGLTRYFAHWIASASVRHDVGYPGRTASTSAGAGLTWYVWRKTYIGAGFDLGDVSYMLLPGRALVDYRGSSYNVGFSRWFDDRSGINVRLDYGETTFYESGGVSLSLFREW